MYTYYEGGAFYILFSEKSRKLKLKNLMNPSVEYISGFWGIMDKNPIARNAIKSMMVNIPYNNLIYIPRLF